MRTLLSLIRNSFTGMAFAVAAAGAQAEPPPHVGAVYNAGEFPGATVGDKIAACIGALPPTGGICDARSLPPEGTIPGMTIAKSGITILGPCGRFTVTGSIRFYNASNGIQQVSWQGCGAGYNDFGTEFAWQGNPSDPLFRLIGVRETAFENLHVNASSGAPLATAFQLETQSRQASTNRTFRNILVEGTNGGIGKGFRWCAGDRCGGSGPDTNNDMDTLVNVTVSNYDFAAFSIEHGQSKSHLFFRDSCNSNGFGRYCVYAPTGSFTAIGMSGGSNRVADFYLGMPDDTIVIQSCDLEASDRLLLTGRSGWPWPVTISGCRWAANKLNSDNKVISYNNPGTLNLIGNIIDSPRDGAYPEFDLGQGSAPVAGVAVGNTVFWDATTTRSNPFTSNVHTAWTLLGNYVNDAGSHLHAVPDSIASGASCSGPPTGSFESVNGVVTHC